MIPDFSGDFLNYESTKDGDICEVIDEGKKEYSDKLQKEMFNISVNVNGKKKVWSPNNTHGRAMQEAFGLDTKEWIGKKFTIIHADKKMLIRPVKAQTV